MKAIYLLGQDSLDKIYGPAQQAAIAKEVEFLVPPQTAESILADPACLRDVEAIFSGWGMAELTPQFLALAPKLNIVFYGAGSVRGFVTPASWERGVRVTCAYAANAIPVAEFTLAEIIFSLKRGWHYTLSVKQDGRYPVREPIPGMFGTTVGIVSLGMIGRRVCEMLKAFDVKVIAFDPFANRDEVRRTLNAELVSLEDVFARADVVSLHTPWLKETEGMVTGAHFRAMKNDATFINTARGAVIREPEMVEALKARPDLFAVLDVTYPEPPVAGSPLYSLPNVVLTPHIAGSVDAECQRMGQYMVDELVRYKTGQPLKWEITREKAAHMA